MQSYADDTKRTVKSISNNMNYDIHKLNVDLTNIKQYFDQHRILIQPTNSYAILFYFKTIRDGLNGM